jgi:hypothetical protein
VRSQTFGRVFENFVASELIKQSASSKDRFDLLHFRTSDGKEIDFVLERPDGKLAAIETKARDSVDAGDSRGLRELQDKVAGGFLCGVVLYRGRNLAPFGERLWAMPVSELWA